MSTVETLTPKIGMPVNTKLGPGIYSWSISAGISCPGATSACLSCCYALSGFFRMPNVGNAHNVNFRFSATDEFVPWMLKTLDAFDPRIFRIHVAGDMYSDEYINKWIDVVAKTPKTNYYAYTRSWRLPPMLKELRRLAKFKNMHLWFSADVDTGKPPKVAGVRTAFMARDAAEEETIPDWADLVFRNERDTIRKKINGVQVCPVETGLENELTCTKCKICFSKQKQIITQASPNKKPNFAKLKALNVVQAF